MAEGVAPTPARAIEAERPYVESGWDVTLQMKLESKRGQRYLNQNLRRRIIRVLRKRDGDGCCFGPWCLYGGQLDFRTPAGLLPQHLVPSIEHRQPWYRYRTHQLEHMALAHHGCNQRAGRLQWAYITREERLARKAPRIRIDAWPALTYADELDFGGDG